MTVQRTIDQGSLLERIHQHLTELDAKYRFAYRLARENHWPLNFTYEVINEYAKFLFLAKEGGHPVSPPPIIDQAWHLHLLHTESYWGELCPKILGMNLHHVPATGSKKEAARLEERAAQTLTSYRSFFGEPHPLWLTPNDTTNPSKRKNVGFALAGVAAGLLLCSAIAGVIFYALGGLLFAVAALGFLTERIEGPYLMKYPHPRIHAKPSRVTCGGNSGDASASGGSGCGGHSCGSGGGH